VIPAPLQKFAEDRGLMQRHRGEESRAYASCLRSRAFENPLNLGAVTHGFASSFQWLFGSKSLESKRIRARDAVLCAIDNTQEGNGGNW
jgi:hypothetical protein